MTPRRTRLDQANQVYSGYGLWPLEDHVEALYPLADLEGERPAPAESRAGTDAVVGAIANLAVALREFGYAKSTLGVLLLDDGLTVGQIAGRIDLDPNDVYSELAGLQEAGIVCVDRSGGVDRYSVRQPRSSRD